MNATILDQLTKDLIFNSDEPSLILKYHLTYINYIRSSNASVKDIEEKERYINETVKYLLLDAITSSKNTSNYIKIVGPIWILISIIGLVSNLLVVLVLCGNSSQLVYQVFCVGLAITDLCFLSFGATFTVLHYIFNNWMFGQFLCKFVNYIIYISLYSSSIMLLSLTTSRFLAVVHPWKHKQMKTIDAKWACIAAWIIGIIFSIPIPIIMTVKRNLDLFQSTHQTIIPVTKFSNSTSKSLINVAYHSHGHSHRTTGYFCYDHFPSQIARSSYQIFTTIVTYLIPFTSITIMNSMIVHKLRKKEKSFRVHNKDNKQRKVRVKVTQLVFAVTTLYCICWLPIQIFNVWFNAFRPYFQIDQHKFKVKLASQTLAYLSSCINPFVYSVMSGLFKESVSARLPKFISRRQRSTSSIGESSLINCQTYTTGHCNKNFRSRNSLPAPIEKKDSIVSTSDFSDVIIAKSSRSYSNLI